MIQATGENALEHSIFCLSGTPGNTHPGMGLPQAMTPGNLGMVFKKNLLLQLARRRRKFRQFILFRLDFFLFGKRFGNHTFRTFSLQICLYDTREWE